MIIITIEHNYVSDHIEKPVLWQQTRTSQEERTRSRPTITSKVQCFQLRLATRGNHIFYTDYTCQNCYMLFILTFLHVAQQITTEIFTQGSWRHFPNTTAYLRRVRTMKPGWCGSKANRIYPGWIRVAHVRTQSGLMRVQRTWTVWATSRQLKRTTTHAPVARLSVYSVLQRSKNVLGARARCAPFLTQFQPTWTHMRMWVGWNRVQPGFAKSGLSADSQYSSSIRVEPGFAR